MTVVKKEKKRLIYSSAYYLKTSNTRYSFKGHKRYDQYLIVTLKNEGGYLEFEFTSRNFKDGNRFVNPATGSYIFPLRKEEKFYLYFKTVKAKGAFKIEKLTVKQVFKK